MYGHVVGPQLQPGLDAPQHDVVGDLTGVAPRQDVVLHMVRGGRQDI